MIELLILYELNKTPLTMYGISRNIKSDFNIFMIPSLGTIQPALKRLEKQGAISYQKFMSAGGRPSKCYAITSSGKDLFSELLVSPMPENPVQFLVNARLRLYCAQNLSDEYIAKLIKQLKRKTEVILIESKKKLENDNLTFYPKMVIDNLNCEYKNFTLLLEGIEHACNH